MLQGKRILITGASRGFGAELARALDREGAQLILTARSAKDLERVASELEGDVLLAAGDLTRSSFREELAQLVQRELKGLDILVNNAGVIQFRPLEKTSDADYAHLFGINVAALIGMTRLCLPMLKRSRGDIFNVSSLAGITVTGPNSTLYIASKHAVTGFTKALRSELKGTGVRVLAIYPGGMRTNLFDGHLPKRKVASFMDPAEVVKLVIAQLDSQGILPVDLVVEREKA